MKLEVEVEVAVEVEVDAASGRGVGPTCGRRMHLCADRNLAAGAAAVAVI